MFGTLENLTHEHLDIEIYESQVFVYSKLQYHFERVN